MAFRPCIPESLPHCHIGDGGPSPRPSRRRFAPPQDEVTDAMPPASLSMITNSAPLLIPGYKQKPRHKGGVSLGGSKDCQPPHPEDARSAASSEFIEGRGV